jgi:flavin-dependent dehydrogenase
MKSAYDVVILGGGPAGATAATLVAEAGFDTLLVEREKMPRFHVGESLMPETYWTFKRLGILPKMQESNFTPKLSVQFVSHNGKESQPFFFPKHDPRECSRTWQIERAEFDKMLWDHAEEKGAEVHDETRVMRILFDDHRRARGVTLQNGNGDLVDIEARVVMDGTGQQCVIANQLGLKRVDPNLRKAAIWSYYRNAHRDPTEHGGATIIMHTEEKKSWFWFIPLSNDITSVGVVGDNDYLLKGRGTPDQVFEEELAICPGLVRRLPDAELVSKHHVAKEFSYTTTQQSGDGWVLIGDAFGFIDPIYSSGVYFALRSGELAADAVVEGLRNDDTSAEQLGAWVDSFKDGTQLIRKLVSAYYTNDFSFGRFMKEHPEHQDNLTDLLIGRIFYDGAGRIFDDMDPALTMSSTP